MGCGIRYLSVMAHPTTDAPDLAHTPAAQQRDHGRGLRSTTPRRTIAAFERRAEVDPIAILSAQNADRLRDLVPLRRERMSESPFAFYRGAAAIMAADLAGTPSSGLTVQICGDAHLSNFGLFASRDRELVFDVNDFDETNPGPWEWDLKRLVTSVVILAQAQGLDADAAHDAARQTAAAYRRRLAGYSAMPATERFFAMTKFDDILTAAKNLDTGHGEIKRVKKAATKARGNTSERALGKLTAVNDDGGVHIVDQPPLTTRVPGFDAETARQLAAQYLAGMPEDVAALLGQLSFQDSVIRVVGVGSVGTRCLLSLFTDADGAPLFLQIKEATASVLEPYTSPSEWDSPGHRVVAGQRMMQSTGDPFLGHFIGPAGRSFYVRQFRDMKGGVDPSTLTTAPEIVRYAAVCANSLARAHSQSGIGSAISGYLGSGDVADGAFADFAVAYAAQNARDHAALLAASDEAWSGE